jgi:hypothetical protein
VTGKVRSIEKANDLRGNQICNLLAFSIVHKTLKEEREIFFPKDSLI